jgi:hypothetical protein
MRGARTVREILRKSNGAPKQSTLDPVPGEFGSR